MNMRSFEKLTGFIDYKFEKKFFFHRKSFNLVSARSSIKYLIKLNKFKKIYIPKYICEDVKKNIKIKYQFYNLKQNLKPDFDFSKIKSNEAILIVNYFGVLDFKEYNKKKNIIFDFSQSYYSKIKKANVVYSPRKFFPVPDGGHLYSIKKIKNKLFKVNKPNDVSFLFLKGKDQNNLAFKKYQLNEKNKNFNKELMISEISNEILSNINYNVDKKKRIGNFITYHKIFKKTNLLKINNQNKAALCYPLLLEKNLINKLKSYKIYIPVYWRELKNKFKKNSFENKLVNQLHCLPVDSRLNKISIYRYFI